MPNFRHLENETGSRPAQWKTESNARRKSTLAIAIVVFSLAQIFVAIVWLPLATGFGTAFLLLNGLVLLIGVSFLFSAKEVITVDAELQTIVLETGWPLRRKVTEVSLRSVADVSVRSDGYGDEGNLRYYVAARLKTGRELALFRGFYEGNHDRKTVEARCERLRRLLPTDA